MATTVSNAEIAKMITSLAEQVAVSNVRLVSIEGDTKKLTEAMYGNGAPGVKEQLRHHQQLIETMGSKGGEKVQEIDEHVKTLLATHTECNIAEVMEQVKEIAKRHDEEDRVRGEVKEETKNTRRENRKWFLALALTITTSVVMTVIDFVYHIIGVK